MRAIIRQVRPALGRALRDERGAMGLLMAVGMVAFLGFVGLSVDAVRGYLVQSRLSGALDAAGLAGSRVMFSPTRDDDIRMYFNTNFPDGYLGATVTGPTITEDAKKEVLTLKASAVIDTSFMRVLGFQTMTVGSFAEITRKTEMLDLVLAIDMSGSMGGSVSGGGTRIEAARLAATELIDILFGEDALKSLLKIGVVPWSAKVNVTINGSTFDSAATTTVPVPTFINPVTGASQDLIHYVNNSPVPLLSGPAAGWKGCVYNRFIRADGSNNDADDVMGPATVNGKDWVAWEVVGPEGEPPGTSWPTPAACVSHGITPLIGTKADVQAAVDELVSPTGSTNIPQGLGWAWRVLVPQAPFTDAVLNPQGNRTQAIILLTDGENYGYKGDGYKGTFGWGSGGAGAAMDARLLKVAEAIKAQGVLIYAIQFAQESSDLADLLKEVASGPDAPFYHLAPGKEELRQVFREVANDLSQLRISR